MAKKQDKSAAETAIRDTILAYRKESEDASRDRARLVRDNWDAIHGRHDFSHKQKHQSKEWLPESSMALEQIGAFMKRALVDFGRWFKAEPIGLGPTPIPQEAAERLIGEALHSVDFPTLVADAIKLASIESMATAKIHGRIVTDRRFFAERGVRFIEKDEDGQIRIERVVEAKVRREEFERWQLAIDLVPFSDFFPDPRGRKLYEVHRVERDLHELREMEEKGVYDPDVVNLIEEDFERAEDEASKLVRTAQTRSQPPPFRKRVVLDECWGTILSRRGRVLETAVVATIANEKYLIRPPEDNPFWHGESPFVSEPLIRVPLSVWHKAILDHAVPLNRVMSELLNLIIDGGFKSVWGLGQVRPDVMENPEEITDGIPQGFSAVLKPGTPANQKWYERVDTPGEVREGLGVFQAVSQAHQKATAVPDIKIGALPPKQVLACVPTDCEALTPTGWRMPDTLSVGDEVLGFNLQTGQCEWTWIERLYFYDDAPTVRYQSAKFDVVCTADHKWVQRTNGRYPDGQRRGPSKLLPVAPSRHLLQAAPAPDGKGLGELPIHQLLDRPNLVAEVLRMTSAERQAFIMGVLAGEGSVNKSKLTPHHSVVMAQNDGPVLDAFRIACTLEGIATSEYTPTLGRPCRRVSLLRYSYRSTVTFKVSEGPRQRVWCPVTPLKTWVMRTPRGEGRQGRTITITGNTEIAQVVESTSTIFEGVARDFEDRWMERVLGKIWKVQWQHLDDFSPGELLGVLGTRNALLLQRMLPEERFALMVPSWRFRVFGIRAILSRAKDFQKIVTFLELLGKNEVLAAAFEQEFSVQKLLAHIVKTLDIDPDELRRDEGEQPVAQMGVPTGGNGKVRLPNPANLPATVPLREGLSAGRAVG